MTWLDAFVLGLVQGLSEFLPISSSGHLVMAQWLLGVPTPGILLEVVLHVATLLSVVWVYWRQLLDLARGALAGRRDAWRYIGLLALASVPAGVVGVFFQDAVERAFETPAVTGVMLLVTGGILLSTRYPVATGRRRGIGAGGALAMGVAQAFAILPGVSRSGTTISAGLWGRIEAPAAAQFSFLMSLPAIAGAALLQALDLERAPALHWGALGLAFATALVSGVAAIRWLLWLVRRQAFHLFAYYVWVVGAAFLALLWWRG
ncbi:MAG TPA: undecaprenyl-diphosphate phosphatase [Thermoanaerobaculia bacterium]|nr:undecaprenyl-diphosphate phosphatase [Thermoanaerobaculia bacterium]